MGGAVGSNGRPRFAVFVDAQVGEFVEEGTEDHLQVGKFAMLLKKKACSLRSPRFLPGLHGNSNGPFVMGLNFSARCLIVVFFLSLRLLSYSRYARKRH